MAYTGNSGGADCKAENIDLIQLDKDDFLDGEHLSIDENNIATLTVRYLHVAGDILGTTNTISNHPCNIKDFQIESMDCEALNDGSKKYITTAVYKALDITQRDPNLNVGDEFGIVESIDYDFSEEPLETHPNIVAIAKKFGGVPRPDGTYDFPQAIPKGVSTDRSGGLAFGGAGSEVNPMFGMKTYPAVQARYTKTFGTKRKWKNYIEDTGKIVSNIPDTNLDVLSQLKGRNWLQLPPKIQKEGQFYRCSVEYLLSAVGKKWPEAVFENL